MSDIDVLRSRCEAFQHQVNRLREEKQHAEAERDQAREDVAGMRRDIGALVKERETAEAQLAEARAAGQWRPKVICLCGSTRFIEQFAIQTWELERQGHIVIGCTLLPAWYCGVPSHFGEATGTKAQCDELHLRKIDMADEVLVLNIGGYIGESTRNEIAYAERVGKPVRYFEAAPPAAAVTDKEQA